MTGFANHSTTSDFAERLLAISAEDLDGRDRDAVRWLLLDHLGVVANGSTTPSARAASAFVRGLDTSSSFEFPLIGTTEVAPVLHAALVNGVAGHSIEYDDVHNASSSHPGVVVFPAALAAASLANADSQLFLRACLVGYEGMCRVGRAVNPAAHYAAHYHPTATIGHFGATVAAAVILDLDPPTLTSAIGLAATMAAGSMEFLRDGAWTKRLHPGHAARDGVEAALLAANGFRGTADGIAGARGFLEAYTSDSRPDALMEEWGERPYEVHATSIKAHTCCRYMQGAIDALLEIREEGRLQPDDVAAVRIGIPSVAVDIVWNPIEHKRQPTSVVDAQFSMPYGAAVALSRGRASLAEFQEGVIRAPDLTRIMGITECVVDPELDRTYPEMWRAWAEIETADGRRLRAEIDHPKGDPTNPLTPNELRSKFEMLTAGVFSPKRQREASEAILGLGEEFTLSDLTQLLSNDVT